MKEHGILRPKTEAGGTHQLREIYGPGVARKSFDAGVAVLICSYGEMVLTGAGKLNAEIGSDEEICAILQQGIIKNQAPMAHGEHETKPAGIHGN